MEPELRSPRVALAVIWSLFQLWAAFAGSLDLMIQIPLHVAFATDVGKIWVVGVSTCPRV